MTGTPKQEADRLYDKFWGLVPSRAMHFDRHKMLAKDCALACVEEIMKSAEESWNVDDKNYEHSGHSKFWLEVKLELLQK